MEQISNIPNIIQNTEFRSYCDAYGSPCNELLITLFFPSESVPISAINRNGCYLSIRGQKGILKIPVYKEEMKFFYENFKDYYYLPEEDMAIHKSVSSYVDASFRRQAKESTCYVRRFSSYLPQWDAIFHPFFRRAYHTYPLFFEWKEEWMTDKNAISLYVHHILHMIEI